MRKTAGRVGADGGQRIRVLTPKASRGSLGGMKTRATLKPGVPGTRKLVEKYGKRLVRVRYRYDPRRRRRYTTVELLEDEGAWDRRGGRWSDRGFVVHLHLSEGRPGHHSQLVVVF